MQYTITRLSSEDKTSSDIAKALSDNRPATYKLEHYSLSGVGAVPRDLLAFGGVEWEDVIVTSWPHSVEAPFGVFPVLHIRTADGTEFKIAESFVIEHFLAKKFGLLGDNEWEELQIKMFHSSSLYLRERSLTGVTWNYKDKVEEATERFITKTLPLWIDTHTKHLKDNGSNGHYVGNKLSLADIQTANDIDHFQFVYRGDEIIEKIKKSDEIWRVKERVDTDPRLREWRQSEGYKNHIAASKSIYANTGI
ncbi:Glutathione S-transferase S1 [Lobosporangium transversale]|uniref:glutathione transferase n=1 Tax=Lobosporangium transversale TaxID=64571 RepID=A0A1Y2H0W9_9FUNG|nr:hypothetical protein BCR41DRAFT_383074 [Lobosporangium transversale]KAF9918013.1 Glutathione S-transferase S1 [Lobosporangium transversale]ORZ28200.1 hypothetical protein BCR41DRAFT_383074 [Lobosporangium transversale]|eukprot:XP_021885885.1 hypothetical protein BCR41DRAFT_383074 [Lobosporangium transversale]